MAPIPISRAEYAAMYGGVTDPSPAMTTPTPIPISRADYAAQYGSAPAEQPSMLSNFMNNITSADWWMTRPSGERISPSNVVDNITSKDWWMTRPSGERITAGQGIAGPGLSLLDSLTAGGGDEITAAGGALIDKIVGGPGYDIRLADARNTQESFANASPTADAGLRIMGALKTPLGSSVKAEDGLIKATTKLAGEGAGYGGTYGFGDAEGGAAKRVESAVEGAKSGAIGSALLGGPLLGLSKVAGWVADKAPGVAEKFFNKAAGAKPSDFVSSAKRNEFSLEKTGNTSLKQSLRQARREGVFNDANNYADAYKNNITISKSLSGEVERHIKQADAMRPKNVKIYPRFKNAERYIKEGVADDAEGLRNQLEAYKQAIRAEGDGSAAYLQRQKIKLYEKVYPDGGQAREGLDKAIAKDLMQSIEEVTNATLPAEQAGAVRTLNRRLGALEETRPLLRREMARDEGTSVGDQVMQFIRTSGGVGVPILSGAYGTFQTGDPKYLIGGLGAGLAMKYGQTPKGAVQLGRKLRNISPFSAKVSDQTRKTMEAVPRLLTASGSGGQSATPTQMQAQSQPTPASRNITQSSPPIVKTPSIYNNPSASATQPNKQPVKYTRESVKQMTDNLHPFLRAVVKTESAGNPNAVSRKGATGLMQLMPATAREVAGRLGLENYDITDPETNLALGTRYLQEQIEEFKDPELALAAYNAGPEKVKEWQRKYGKSWNEISRALKVRGHYTETVNYVPTIMRRFRNFATA